VIAALSIEASQAWRHALSVQTSPVAQALPHAPQFSGSFERSVQVPSQVSIGQVAGASGVAPFDA
jgi:hypothetical protein